MKHTYILDTNILLDDPHAITSFDDNNIVIPLIVVEEMDRFKDKPGELGANAREFSRYLGKFISDDVYRLNEGVATESGGHLRVVTISELSEHGADLSKFPELEDYNGGGQ
jgi:PhoH-like ATPase